MRADGHPCAVLVVEDDWIVRHTIVELFESDGWVVLDAASGEDALRLASSNHVDAVFTDVQLAGVISGWEVAEALRRASPELVIVYASGDAADRTRQVAESRFFVKPYMAEEVIAVCGDLVCGRPALQAGHPPPTQD
jgi:CheY-like chemotaxis protein